MPCALGTYLMSEHVLEAALRPSAAALPISAWRMWTTARRLTELVARYDGVPVEAVDRIDKVLSDRDFMFRRGGPAEVH
jgi:hypothetical protein